MCGVVLSVLISEPNFEQQSTLKLRIVPSSRSCNNNICNILSHKSYVIVQWILSIVSPIIRIYLITSKTDDTTYIPRRFENFLCVEHMRKGCQSLSHTLKSGVRLPIQSSLQDFFSPSNWSYRVAINTDGEDCSVSKFEGEESDFELKHIKFQSLWRLHGRFLNFITCSSLKIKGFSTAQMVKNLPAMWKT